MHGKRACCATCTAPYIVTRGVVQLFRQNRRHQGRTPQAHNHFEHVCRAYDALPPFRRELPLENKKRSTLVHR